MSQLDNFLKLLGALAQKLEKALSPISEIFLKISSPLMPKKSMQENAMDIIHNAAAKGDLQQLKIILSMDNPCFDIPDAHGETPLFFAARSGHLEIVEFLLQHDANPKHVNIAGQSVLFGPVAKQHFKVIDKLIEVGADPALCDESGNSLLHHAILSDQHPSLVFLLEGGKIDIDTANNFGQTPLSLAASQQMLQSCKIIIQKQATIDKCDNDGWTPLMLAVSKGNYEICNQLISSGASVAVHDSQFAQTPYLIATRHGHLRIMELLLKQGADPFAKDYYDRTALHIAVETNNLEIVNFVLDTKVSISEKDRFGMSAKDWAVVNASSSVLGAILKKEKTALSEKKSLKVKTLEDLKPSVDMSYLPDGDDLLRGATEQQLWQEQYEKTQKRENAQEAKALKTQEEEKKQENSKRKPKPKKQPEEEFGPQPIEDASSITKTSNEPIDINDIPVDENPKAPPTSKKPIDYNDMPLDEEELVTQRPATPASKKPIDYNDMPLDEEPLKK